VEEPGFVLHRDVLIDERTNRIGDMALGEAMLLQKMLGKVVKHAS
jgi:hypothetical protein